MITQALAGAAALLIYWQYRKRSRPSLGTTIGTVISDPHAGTSMNIIEDSYIERLTRPENLVPIKLGNDTWLVAPDYVGPMGIGKANDLAKTLGFELPTPALVDAIWREADLKLTPITRWPNNISKKDYQETLANISKQVANRPFKLLAGSFKDIVMQSDGFPGLYGWHVDVEHGMKVPSVTLHNCVTPGPGKVIQPLSGHAHGQFYEDYSQGLRLVKKVLPSA